MTIRALVIGFISALLIASVGYVNDRILELESINSGHLIPVAVVGSLFLFVALLNPLLWRIRKSLAFRPAELAVITILSMCACSIPGRGLMEQFTQCLITPYHWERVTPGWKEHELMQYVPDGAYATVTESTYDRVVAGYMMGANEPKDLELPFAERIRKKWDRVPWGAWAAPMRTWVPLILLAGVCSVCMALVVHRQWSSHEFLSYPIASFTSSLIERDSRSIFPTVFRSKPFWIGLAIVYLIRFNNGMYVWFPEYVIPVTLKWNMTPFAKLCPSIYKVDFGNFILRVEVFPLIIAFAFFLSSEIALTLGLNHAIWMCLAVPMTNMGINLSTDYGLGGWSGYQRAGSYLAFALMLLYTGRQYYKEVSLRAVFLLRDDRKDEGNVWALRILMVASVALIWLITRMGLELPYAALTVILMLLTFVMTSRISAETGMFFIQPRWQPFGVLIGMFGGYSMGPSGVFICSLVCICLCIDQSQNIMPYLTNGLKIADRVKLKPRSVAGVNMAMYVVGVILAITVVLYATYDFGAPNYNWSVIRVPSMPFQAVEKEVLQLKGVGLLEQAETLPWYSRLDRIVPKENFWWAAGVGFFLVIAVSMLRLRVPKWPLHPVVFLVWATYPAITLSSSFFMGWLAKKAAVRFGGDRTVQKLKPLMTGIIAGELLGALTFMLVGAVYFFVTHKKPLAYVYFPR